jgi:hypothetical protein
MALDKNINYLVSGIERSGTSMLMQILDNGGVPLAQDEASRPPDEDNPKGYYELEGGKIINALMDGTFPIDDYKGLFIKITAYGMKFLPKGEYRVLYSERNIEEILDSMEKMAKIKDTEREETRAVFLKLNSMIKDLIQKRDDIDVLFVNYNEILSDPEKEVTAIHEFLSSSDFDLDKMIETVDQNLYRKRRT